MRSGESAVGQVAENQGPDCLDLGADHIRIYTLRMTVAPHRSQNHDGFGHNPPGLPHLALGYTLSEGDEQVATEPAWKSLCAGLVNFLVSPRNGGRGHGRFAAYGLDEFAGLARQRPDDIAGRDHRPLGLNSPTARLNSLGEEVALAQLRVHDLDLMSQGRR